MPELEFDPRPLTEMNEVELETAKRLATVDFARKISAYIAHLRSDDHRVGAAQFNLCQGCNDTWQLVIFSRAVLNKTNAELRKKGL